MKDIPGATYRVSIKAIIRDEAGRILLVKEHADYWSLPGGGIDHGETVEDALARELHEELAVDTIVSYQHVGTHSYYSERASIWRMWLLFEVKIGSFDVAAATDGIEAAFIDIESLATSTHPTEQRIYSLFSAQPLTA